MTPTAGKTAVRVRIPATSANLGPGFDALGIALGLYNEIEVSEADGLTVSIEGEGAQSIERDEGNVVVRGIRAVCQLADCALRGLELRLINRIPPSRGLGSSAAAWLGGVLAGNVLAGHPLSRAQCLTLAIGYEGHPDNLTAACYGGLTIAVWDGSSLHTLRVPLATGLHLALLVPSVEASTSEARALLPLQVSMADAVHNLSRAALLVGALRDGRWDLLASATEDRLHQPYRRALFPWMPTVFDAARSAGAVGVVLSGAGPSILAFVPGPANAVASAMQKAMAPFDRAARGLVLSPDTEGAQVLGPKKSC